MLKIYLKSIQRIQKILIPLSIILLLIIFPSAMAFWPENIPGWFRGFWFDIALWTVFLVMIVRPLADLLPKGNLIRPLVILRKSFGILSASVILMFLMEKIIISENYLLNYFNLDFWFSGKYSFLARISEITAVILLVTSNNFSKKVLGKWWKRIQKLSYLYFASGALYIGLSFRDKVAIWMLIIVVILVLAAWIKNRRNNKIKNAKNS